VPVPAAFQPSRRKVPNARLLDCMLVRDDMNPNAGGAASSRHASCNAAWYCVLILMFRKSLGIQPASGFNQRAAIGTIVDQIPHVCVSRTGGTGAPTALGSLTAWCMRYGRPEPRQPTPGLPAEIGTQIMPADGHAIPFIALVDGKFNVTEEAAEFLRQVSTALFGLCIRKVASALDKLPGCVFLHFRWVARMRS
jgi:hypothetical protein